VCGNAANGTCEDGAPEATGSDPDACIHGYDCTDCGPRYEKKCDDTCAFAQNGPCDDGGPGSALDPSSALCVLGTDCTDCGPR
jgi:hypothetical protein